MSGQRNSPQAPNRGSRQENTIAVLSVRIQPNPKGNGEFAIAGCEPNGTESVSAPVGVSHGAEFVLKGDDGFPPQSPFDSERPFQPQQPLIPGPTFGRALSVSCFQKYY